MEETFEDEVFAFLMKAIIVSGLIYVLTPPLVKSVLSIKGAVPGQVYIDPNTGAYYVYVP